jgi:hypothetical protein
MLFRLTSFVWLVFVSCVEGVLLDIERLLVMDIEWLLAADIPEREEPQPLVQQLLKPRKDIVSIRAAYELSTY